MKGGFLIMGGEKPALWGFVREFTHTSSLPKRVCRRGSALPNLFLEVVAGVWVLARTKFFYASQKISACFAFGKTILPLLLRKTPLARVCPRRCGFPRLSSMLHFFVVNVGLRPPFPLL